MSATHKTRCEDGVERTFHQSGVLSKDGFVYANSHRIYGASTEVHTLERGYHHIFIADESSTHRALVQPVPETATA